MKKLLPANPNGLGTGAGHLQYKPMKNPTAYLKMRVLGAIDMAEGKSIHYPARRDEPGVLR